MNLSKRRRAPFGLVESIKENSVPIKRYGGRLPLGCFGNFAVSNADVLHRRIRLKIPEFDLAPVIADIENLRGPSLKIVFILQKSRTDPVHSLKLLKVKAVQIHYLGPSRGKVMHKLFL